MLVITGNTLRQQLTNTEGKERGYEIRYHHVNRTKRTSHIKSHFDYISNSMPCIASQVWIYCVIIMGLVVLYRYLSCELFCNVNKLSQQCLQFAIQHLQL